VFLFHHPLLQFCTTNFEAAGDIPESACGAEGDDLRTRSERHATLYVRSESDFRALRHFLTSSLVVNGMTAINRLGTVLDTGLGKYLKFAAECVGLRTVST
jgi:hypothetical protein